MRVLIVCVLTAVFLGSSVASGVTYSDPNDTAGPLDIERVALTNLRDPARLRFELHTYGEWTRRRCERAAELEDGCSIRFSLDTRGAAASRATGRGLDYWLSWRGKDRVVVDPDTLSVVTDGRADKDGDSISCVFRRDALDIRKKIRWFATTTWANPDGAYATDYAPDAGWYG